MSRLFVGFIQWKMSPDDALWSKTSSSCDVEPLELAVEGEGSFLYFDRLGKSSREVEERGVTEEDEDDEDGIPFVTLESQFENKETVLNW